ncbi:aspartyl protease family protein [Alteromonas oceanisediminis]|uniref:aspartyl protease family protein n=1 Tax=Alteromonas oceanisediminis TaxID=2836180 RepID=UPI001BDB28EC|nr:aspartyl protease family protein [Alteromonas oceanisediminis]MBT0585985.1 aspartyl protease family protein [Alteromonas oceanisediminis]
MKILVCVLTVVALSGCSVVNQIRMRFENDDLTARWTDKQDTVALPTRYISNKPHVQVAINGEEGFLFLVDSGASITYLMDSPKVANLKLEKGFDLIAAGWGDGDDSTAYQVAVEQLDLSGVSFEGVSMAYLPVSKSPYYERPDEVIIDGVLGHDILKHFVWRFDEKHNQIDISRTAFRPGPNDVAVDFDISMSKLSVPVNIALGGGRVIEHDVLIDTGSRHYFKLNQTYLDEESISLNLPSVEAADFGLSGKAVHQRVTLPGITIGSIHMPNIKTNLIVSDDAEDFWVIGSAALNQYVTVLDYQQNKLFITPYPNHQFSSQFNLLGLELRKITSGHFVVRYIMPDMATAHVDINVGDIITSIGGSASEQLTEDEWLTISDQPGEYEICRLREPDTEQGCFTVVSEPIEGYSNRSGSTDVFKL